MVKQKNNSYTNLITSDIDDDLYDVLLYQINKIIYNYGDHLKSGKSFKRDILKRNIIKLFYRLYRYKFLLNPNLYQKKKIALSNAYVSIDLNQTILFPPWAFSIKGNLFSSWNLSNIIIKINEVLEKESIKSILSPYFLSLIKEYENEFIKLLKKNNVTCLIVPFDISFFENLSIKLVKKIKIPTIVYLHGLPARYNLIDDNRADYLIVWGKGLKESYINAGFSPDKILTLKHPFYSNIVPSALKSNIEHVVVISKAMPGAPISSTKVELTDRSKSLYYVAEVKNLLLQLGVKSAKLRLHPSESKSFYQKNLTDDFYSIDYDDKITTLNNATLIIGPTSTMVLDAIKSGVNYILFDPIINNKTLDHEENLVRPFDGSSFIKLSKNIHDFKTNIANPQENINIDLLNDYLYVDQSDEEHILNIIA